MVSSDNNGDKFYTKAEIASYCVRKVEEIFDYDDFVHIVEPSAGSGSFLNYLPEKCQSFDIEPYDDRIIQQNWLEFHSFDYSNGLLIGNPPFGKRSILAKEFIRHGIELNFDTIAFILPKTFKKLAMQKVFPNDWFLVFSEDLERDSFSYKENDIDIPCAFMIWTKRETGFDNIRAVKAEKSPEFDFLRRSDDTADFCIIGTSGKVVEFNQVTNPKGTHYIKSNIQNVEYLKEKFRSITYDLNSSVSGGVAWLSQNDILLAYHENNSLSIK